MNKDIENLKNIVVDLEDAENGAIINLSQEEINSLKSILESLEAIQELNLPIKTLVAEYIRLENLEDHTDELKIKLQDNKKILEQLLEDMKERANNFSFESEIMWRKIEKADKLL
jgi:hypothetical protein